jgi:hypothetical protein
MGDLEAARRALAQGERRAAKHAPGRGDLFGPRPAAARRKLAHCSDCGCFPDGRVCAFFTCECGWESGWVGARSVSEAKRGIPCERCNQKVEP